MTVEQAEGWARVYPTVKREQRKNLRQGVWYAVVANKKEDRVTLQLGPRSVDVPRHLLEIRDRRPQHFSIVYRLEAPAPNRAHLDTGKRYLACPQCDSRESIIGHPETHTCSTCAFNGQIGWWEA